MTDAQQRAAAKKFADFWKDKGYEKGQSQPFWLSLLRDVYGVEHPEQFILFEEKVVLDNTSFIDATIPSTKVLIEQKGLGKDLKKPIKQSDGTLLTPFQQAKRYITELPLSKHPRWVVTCNCRPGQRAGAKKFECALCPACFLFVRRRCRHIRAARHVPRVSCRL